MSPLPSVLMTSPLPPPPGGISSWTRDVITSALTERFQIHVLDTAQRDKTNVAGVSRFRFDRALYACQLLLRFGWTVARLRPAIVHVNTSFRWGILRDGLFVWIASLAGSRTILHFHGGGFAESFASSSPAMQRFIGSVLRRADRLLALNRATESFLEAKVGGEKVRLLPNFVSLESFAAPPRREERDAGPVTILFVGWLVAQKGVRELLEVAERMPDVRFVLIGPPENSFVDSIRPTLERLQGNVTVLPPAPPEDIRKLYAAADIFVLPTWREGFPMTVLEAMAAGLPVVATPVGAIPDAIREQQEGLLVPVEDPAALESALRRLVADRELRLELGRSARARVEELFTRQRVVAQLGEIYAEL